MLWTRSEVEKGRGKNHERPNPHKNSFKIAEAQSRGDWTKTSSVDFFNGNVHFHILTCHLMWLNVAEIMWLKFGAWKKKTWPNSLNMIWNKATWHWREPTCLFYYINSDLDLWPWLDLVTFDLDPFYLWPLNHINAQNKVKKSRFSTWRPWPLALTFTHNLDIIFVHHHTKFGDPRSNGSWDMNFFLLAFFLVNVKIKLFIIVTLTFDPWPWP